MVNTNTTGPHGHAGLKEPQRMTAKWLRTQPFGALTRLALEYPYDTCRGILIREEIARRRTTEQA